MAEENSDNQGNVKDPKIPKDNDGGGQDHPYPPEGDQANKDLLLGSSLVLPDQMLPPNLFVLPFSGPIVYPTLLAPIFLSDPKHIATVEEAINRQRILGLLLVKNGELTEKTTFADLYSVGVVVKIVKRLKMPDGTINLLVHAMKRFVAKRSISEVPHIVVEAEYLEDQIEKSLEMDALTRSVISQVKKLSEANPFFTDEMRLAMINAPGPGTVADLVAYALTLPKAEGQEFLETLEVKFRFQKLLLHLRREQDVADLQKKISEDVNNKINKLQREFFLREQLKSVKRELGLEEDPKEKATKSFRERIEAAGMPEDVKKIALQELEKFESISESSPEYNITRNYLETLIDLPWSHQTVDNLDLDHAQGVLDADHFGLDKVKERILEFLAVRKLKEDPKGSIICLVGPPGVGKTSIAKSISKAMGRKFFRFSLGGMRDEAEIKGHRRTYIGAMPGKVLQGMKRAGSKNPVLVLDEIDKLGASYQGDPASALLEVLDPEQNNAFLDHYVDVPYDLSRVLFVTTANTTASIPAPLLDRMEVIELPGYTLEEKEDICARYLIPKELEANGLKPSQVRFEKQAIRKIMQDYAREPGVRTLQQLINRIARKAAAQIVKAERAKKPIKSVVVRADELQPWLGPIRFYNEISERITSPGVVVGLAWTAMGGDILFIEATDLPGSGNIKLTGKMGEVMSESAAIAWSYVKKKSVKDLGLDRHFFKSHDLHLHIPAGAIPKDGPSAGITMATALYSLLSGRKIKQRLAMTGELSLTGKVLPIGGLKEKILAARRAGIRTILAPELNRKDMIDVPAYALEGMTMHFVSHIEDVLKLALEEKAATKSKSAKGRILRSKVVAKKSSKSVKAAKPVVAKNGARIQKLKNV